MSFDISRQSNSEIDTLIQNMIQYYNSHNNSFTGIVGNTSDINTGESYRTNIPLMVGQLQRMVLANPATDLQTVIQEDKNLDLEILEAKEDLHVAHSRAESLQSMNKQSYYESWFPLNRPLRTSSNIILLSIGIFFYLLSFFIILRSAGILIDISTNWVS